MIESRQYRIYALAFLLCFILWLPYQPFAIGEVLSKQSLVRHDKKLSGVTGSLLSGDRFPELASTTFFAPDPSRNKEEELIREVRARGGLSRIP